MLRARQKLGKYRITGRISSGPLADVYRAIDTIHKTKVALKLPKTSGGVSEEEYLHEVQVAVKLQHPNILSVITVAGQALINWLLLRREFTRKLEFAEGTAEA